jgi:hypothetical protein
MRQGGLTDTSVPKYENMLAWVQQSTPDFREVLISPEEILSSFYRPRWTDDFLNFHSKFFVALG